MMSPGIALIWMSPWCSRSAGAIPSIRRGLFARVYVWSSPDLGTGGTSPYWVTDGYARPVRARLPLALYRVSGRLSRLAGRGGGTTVPGRLLTIVDPGAIDRLASRLPLGAARVAARRERRRPGARRARPRARRAAVRARRSRPRPAGAAARGRFEVLHPLRDAVRLRRGVRGPSRGLPLPEVRARAAGARGRR